MVHLYKKVFVLDPVTEILGGPDMYVDAGSTINLTCVAVNPPGIPDRVTWYHHSQVFLCSNPYFRSGWRGCNHSYMHKCKNLVKDNRF